MNKRYLGLPYVLQFLLVNLYGFKIKRKRYNNDFYAQLNNFNLLDRSESPGLNLERIIENTKNSKFHRIKSEQDFYNSPIVNKEIVKENYDSIINPDYVQQYYNTSGTTGSGLKYPVCKQFVFSQWAIFWKFRYLFNLTTESWCAYIIGKSILNSDRENPPYWIKSFFTKQYLFSSCHLNKDTVRLYIEKIKKSKIKWMHGFPSTLNDLADLIEKTNLKQLALELELTIITTSSETFFEFQKRNIEKVFGCKVKQFYSMTEGVASIHECEKGSLHVDE
jgi:phenylacetate-CoA ligase